MGTGHLSAEAPEDAPIAAAVPKQPLAAAVIEDRLDTLIGAVLSSRRPAAGIAEALAPESRAVQDFTLKWVEVTARSSPELACRFAVSAPQALRQLGEAGAERWLVAAMDAFDRDGLPGALATLEDLEGRQARETGQAVRFEEVAGVLGGFVAGLSGRRLKLEAAAQAWTDTETLYLPASIAVHATREANFRTYKLTAALLWAQARYGTFSLAPADWPEGAAREAFGVLEALRLSSRFAQVLPGLARDFDALSDPPAGADFDAARRALAAPGAGAAESAAFARALAGATLPGWSFLSSFEPEKAAAVREARLAQEQALLSRRLADLQGAATLGDGEERLKLEVQELADGELLVEAELDGRPMLPPGDVRALAQSIWQDLGGLPANLRAAAGKGDYQADAIEGEEVAPGAEAGALHYDEWDFRRRHYRKDWCVLREREVAPGDAGFAAATLLRYRPQVRQLRRSFEALRGEDRRLRAEPWGDELDLDAVVRARADMKMGMELDERIFTRRTRRKRDVAVLFMVDMSGSTRGWINDCEREALVLLVEALKVLGDRYAIYGFSGVTRKRCEVYRVKGFDEPGDEVVRRRIAGIEALDYTRMGVAIRHLSGVLCGVEARTRLLITLSDGKPDDFSDGYRGEYGIEDTRQALVEARRMGIHPFCITIDREANSYLPRMYGSVNYAVIDDVARLPVNVAEMYRRLTR